MVIVPEPKLRFSEVFMDGGRFYALGVCCSQCHRRIASRIAVSPPCSHPSYEAYKRLGEQVCKALRAKGCTHAW